MAEPQLPPDRPGDGSLWVHLKWSLLMVAIVVGVAALAIPVLDWFGVETETSPAAHQQTK